MTPELLEIKLLAQQQRLGCLKRCLVNSHVPPYIAESLTEQYTNQQVAIAATEKELHLVPQNPIERTTNEGHNSTTTTN